MKQEEQIKDGVRVLLDSALLNDLLSRDTAEEIKAVLHSIIEEQKNNEKVIQEMQPIIKANELTPVVYFCDRKAECKDSISCGNECIRTFDIRHAKNFKYITGGWYEEKERWEEERP